MPLLVDLLILGSSLQYVAAARLGHPILGWRLTTHAGVTATLILNPLAARRLSEVPGHLTGPTVWAILVELTPPNRSWANGKSPHATRGDSISLALWASAPV